LECLQCNKVTKNPKFCDNSCAAKFSNANRIDKCPGKYKKKQSSCIECGNDVEINLRASHRNAICDSCRYVDKECGYCKGIFQANAFNKRGSVQKYCSSRCRSLYNIYETEMSILGGIASAKKQCRRSKKEIELFELCKSYFVDYEIEHNIPVVPDEVWDADIIIRDIKLAILWNGPWHYKEMPLKNHSLKQVKNRDRIKIILFERNGWDVLVFEDREYTPKKAFEYIKGIYNA